MLSEVLQTAEQANSMIKVSALVVGGVYLYRRLTEGSAEELKASTTVAPLGRFVVAWGVVFLSLSVLAGPSPTLAGSLALLVMLASLLANGVQVSKDVHAALTRDQGKGGKAQSRGAAAPKFEARKA